MHKLSLEVSKHVGRWSNLEYLEIKVLDGVRKLGIVQNMNS